LLKWLNPGHEQSVELGALGHVGWHELLAVDWEKALAFYGELFDWQKRTPTSERWARISSSPGGQTIGASHQPPIDPDLYWICYFNIGDLDAAVAREDGWRPASRRPD
jgi:predicted enzyme related to lactoylglutathione lyase